MVAGHTDSGAKLYASLGWENVETEILEVQTHDSELPPNAGDCAVQARVEAHIGRLLLQAMENLDHNYPSAVSLCVGPQPSWTLEEPGEVLAQVSTDQLDAITRSELGLVSAQPVIGTWKPLMFNKHYHPERLAAVLQSRFAPCGHSLITLQAMEIASTSQSGPMVASTRFQLAGETVRPVVSARIPGFSL